MSATSRAPEPPDGDERSVLLGWLAFHRDVLAAKCAGLDADQLTGLRPSPTSHVRILLEQNLTQEVKFAAPKVLVDPVPASF